jgi:hypothetical protein
MRSVIAVLALAALAVPGTSSAQTLDWAVKGGVTFANLPSFAEFLEEEEDATDLAYRIETVVGGSVGIGISDTLAIQPEMLWVKRGLQGRNPDDAEISLDLDYLSFPILLRFGIDEPDGFRVLLGPTFNFNLRAKAVEEMQIGSGAAERQVRIEDDVKREIEDFDLGLTVGAGYYGRNFIVEGRYEEGLTNALAFDEVDDTHRHRTFLILAGFRFRYY